MDDKIKPFENDASVNDAAAPISEESVYTEYKPKFYNFGLIFVVILILGGAIFLIFKVIFGLDKFVVDYETDIQDNSNYYPETNITAPHSCFDSDEWDDPYTRGFVIVNETGIFKTHYDVCTRNSLRSYTCEDFDDDGILDGLNSWIPHKNPCEFGCAEGRCLREGETEINEQTAICEYRCMRITFYDPVTDLDVEPCNYKGCNNNFSYSMHSPVQACRGYNCFYQSLGCTGDGIDRYKPIPCSGGCNSGICDSFEWTYPDVSCLDSDDGPNPYVKGYTQEITLEYAENMQYDYCILDPEFSFSGLVNDHSKKVESCTGANCHVVERVCPETGRLFHKGIFCENGCVDGACIQ